MLGRKLGHMPVPARLTLSSHGNPKGGEAGHSMGASENLALVTEGVVQC